MKVTPALTILALLVPFVAFSLNEFGGIEEARSRYAEMFIPGVVEEVLLGGVPWCSWCGAAERCFKDEKDSELYEEAEVQSKLNLYEYFKKREKDPDVKVSIAGGRKLYQFRDGNDYLVVMGVPKSGLTITRSPQREGVPLTKVSPAPAEMPPSEKKIASDKQSVPLCEPSAANEEKTSMPVKADAAVSKPVSVAEEEKLAKAGETPRSADQETVSDEEKLVILRKRLEKNPGDFNVRIRMAHIYDRQGNPRRAMRNYMDAVRMVMLDMGASAETQAEILKEVAWYAERNGEYAIALKYYRALLRTGVKEHAQFASSHVSQMLLKVF